MPADFLDLIEVVVYAFYGWRYLLSPSFRAQTHMRWKAEGALSIFFDILFGVFGIALTLLPFWGLIYFFRS